jgi:hypothetical protein
LGNRRTQNGPPKRAGSGTEGRRGTTRRDAGGPLAVLAGLPDLGLGIDRLVA